MSIVRDVLPDIVPDEKIVVEDEEHLFRTTEYRDGTKKSQQKYVLDKAPVVNVKNVYGEVNGQTQDFVEGQDYEVSADKTTVDFSIGGESPDDNTEFYVTYTSRSIIDRYIEAHEEILADVDNKKDQSISANFINQAEGQELDEIGKLFGELGKRRGRGDEEYRVNLKSIVQSFNGRGTVDGIKFAVASGLGVSTDSITVNEDFENTSYRVEIRDFGDLKETNLSTINELVELADPSGVELELLTFIFGPAISTFEGTDEVDYVLETPRVAHTNDGDRVQIDVNSVLTAEEDVFTADDQSSDTDFSRFRTDKVKASAWNTGATVSIDVYRDGNTGYGQQNKITEQHTDTHESTDSQVQDVQEVDLALAGVGIGNIDVTDDGTTTDWEPEDTDTKVDTEISTDSSAQRVDQLDVAHYQDGKFGIDVQNILSSKTQLQQNDNSASDDILAQRIDEVQVASADAGRGQTDVSFDPNTPVIGDDPDSFEETDIEENTDDTVYNTQQLDIAYYQQGSFEIDVQNLLGTTLEVETSDNSGFTDSLAQQIYEVQVASVDSGRGQTDVSFDPNTQVIGDDPDLVEENDAHESTDTSAQRIDAINTAFYQDGTFGIDVHSLVSSSLDIATTDIEELAESISQQVEEVQVASVDAGRGQVDVSFDPNTIIIGDDPDSFKEVNTEAGADESNTSPQEVLMASYNYGVHAIHVSDDGNTTVSGSSPSSFTSTEKSGQNDLRQQQIEQVQELYANEGRVNIDTTDA